MKNKMEEILKVLKKNNFDHLCVLDEDSLTIDVPEASLKIIYDLEGNEEDEEGESDSEEQLHVFELWNGSEREQESLTAEQLVEYIKKVS